MTRVMVLTPGLNSGPKLRIYVSGRMKDYPEHRGHFQRAVELLRALGHETVNPIDTIVPEQSLEPTYEDFIREDLRLLLACEAIYMLEGWERSAGARCEHLVASMIGLAIFYELTT